MVLEAQTNGKKLKVGWPFDYFLDWDISVSKHQCIYRKINMSVFKSTEPAYVKLFLVKTLLCTVLRTAFLWSYIHVNASNVSKTHHMINRYFDVFCSNFPHHMMTRMQIYQAPLQDFCWIKGTIATSSFPRDGITITADTRGIMGIITTPRENIAMRSRGLEADTASDRSGDEASTNQPVILVEMPWLTELCYHLEYYSLTPQWVPI